MSSVIGSQCQSYATFIQEDTYDEGAVKKWFLHRRQWLGQAASPNLSGYMRMHVYIYV